MAGVGEWAERFGRSGMGPQVVCAAVGLGLLRAWLGWALGVVGQPAAMAGAPGSLAHGMLDLGEVLACAGCVWLVARRRPLLGSRGGLVLAFYLCAGLAGTADLLDLGGVRVSAFAATLAMLVAGAGYAGAFLAWVEWCGLGYPARAMVVCAGSYVVSGCAWFYTDAMGPQLAAWTSLALLAGSGGLYAAACAWPDDGPAPGGLYRGPRGQARVCAWVWTFSLVYGIGAMFTGLGSSNAAAKLGFALPMLIILAAFLARGSRFDLASVNRASFLIMLGGFTVALLLENNAVASQMCFSAGLALVNVVAVTYACGAARMRGESAAGLYGTVMLGQSLAAVPTVVLRGDGWPAGLGAVDARTASLMALFLLLVVSLLALREVDLSVSASPVMPEGAVDTGALRAFCERFGLTARETAVLERLAAGMSIAQVSEELFIAPGTVRAHTNHLYEKAGVHSREELLAKLETFGQGGGEG